MQASPTLLSVIVKTFNEEANIARTLEAALKEIAGWPAEIIVADSASSDRTVEIALGFPVRIMVLERPGERSCGVGAQLGYQVARGTYLYVIDGDMEMLPGFLEQAMVRLDADPSLAGVGGLISEAHIPNADCARRDASVRRASAQPVEVSALHGGGLYRRAAVETVGYLTNPNLHSNEELELGLRLHQAGWRLEKLGVSSVLHYGHKLSDFALHRLRWRSRYCWGLGELMRSAIGQSYFLPLFMMKNTLVYAAVAGFWVALFVIIAFGASPAVLVLAPVALVAGMAVRKKNFAHGLHGVINWHLWALGTLAGLLQRQRDPRAPIAARVAAGCRAVRPDYSTLQ